MLAHGRNEVVALSKRCRLAALADANGWHIDAWHMDDIDIEAAIAIYAAVLAGGMTDPVAALLNESGIDLNRLLNDYEHHNDRITRSDLTELAAAASLVAAPGCDIDQMHMPNVPKMSRRKSDSGVDVFAASLQDLEDVDLRPDEQLVIASVKHTVGDSASSMRGKLADSLSGKELTIAYLASQLRVLNARMRQEGLSESSAARLYLFLRDFPSARNISLYAFGFVDADLNLDLIHQVSLLPDASGPSHTFRMVIMPGLRDVHSRCP